MDVKFIRGNLIALVSYSIIAFSLVYFMRNDEAAMLPLILLAILMIGHVLALLIGSLILFIGKNKLRARTFLLSGLLVAIIGWGSCMGGVSLIGLF